MKAARRPVFMTLCTIGPCSTDRHQGSVTQLAHTRARCLGSFDGHVDSVRESSHWTRGGKLKQGLWLGKMGRVRQRWRESWRKRAGECCGGCEDIVSHLVQHGTSFHCSRRYMYGCCVLKKNRHSNMGGTSSLAGCYSIPPTACACE